MFVRATESVRWPDLSGEPARLHTAEAVCRPCRSSESTIAVEAFMNNAGWIHWSWQQRTSRACRDMVFIVTNGLLPFGVVFGLGIVLWHRQMNPDEGEGSDRPTLE
jgi:hypothetical protein